MPRPAHAHGQDAGAHLVVALWTFWLLATYLICALSSACSISRFFFVSDSTNQMADEATTAQIEAAVQGQVEKQLAPIHEQLTTLVTLAQGRQTPPRGESPSS